MTTMQREDDLRQSYEALAEEMNDYGVPPWNEEDWDEVVVSEARTFAEQHGLRFPPGTGDYDRWYEATHA